MTKTYLKLTAAILCAAMPPAAFGQSTDSESVTATAEIVDSNRTLNVSVLYDIEFGEVARPSLPGSVCSYELDTLGVPKGYEIYANGDTLEAPFGGVCTDFSNGSYSLGGVEIECAPNERVTVSATFNDAGIPGVSFDDVSAIEPSFSPVRASLDDVDGSTEFNGQATYFCEDLTQFGGGGLISLDIGGRLRVAADAALGAVEAGSVTIEASYE